MAATNQPLGAGYTVTLTRTFQAPAELVFDCFTQAEHLAKWWGPHGFSAPNTRTDPRAGGTLFIDMQGPGLYDNPSVGEFLEFDRPKRLAFTISAFRQPDGSYDLTNHNTITFSEKDGRTTIVLTTVVQKASVALSGALAGMKAGWGQSLEKLGDLVGGGGKMNAEIRDRSIILSRAFDAPIDRVWEATTKAEHFARWWGPRGYTNDVQEMDVRPGGRWTLVQTGPDGQAHTFFGEFLEVDPPKRLVQTQGFDQYAAVPVTTTFEEEWGRTLVTRTYSFPDNAYRDGMFGAGMEAGAAESYDRLAGLLQEELKAQA
jgi:uncharacterized protein YndB with AHSA1/START domain